MQKSWERKFFSFFTFFRSSPEWAVTEAEWLIVSHWKRYTAPQQRSCMHWSAYYFHKRLKSSIHIPHVFYPMKSGKLMVWWLFSISQSFNFDKKCESQKYKLSKFLQPDQSHNFRPFLFLQPTLKSLNTKMFEALEKLWNSPKSPWTNICFMFDQWVTYVSDRLYL